MPFLRSRDLDPKTGLPARTYLSDGRGGVIGGSRANVDPYSNFLLDQEARAATPTTRPNNSPGASGSEVGGIGKFFICGFYAVFATFCVALFGLVKDGAAFLTWFAPLWGLAVVLAFRPLRRLAGICLIASIIVLLLVLILGR